MVLHLSLDHIEIQSVRGELCQPGAGCHMSAWFKGQGTSASTGQEGYGSGIIMNYILQKKQSDDWQLGWNVRLTSFVIIVKPLWLAVSGVSYGNRLTWTGPNQVTLGLSDSRDGELLRNMMLTVTVSLLFCARNYCCKACIVTGHNRPWEILKSWIFIA